MVALGVEDHIYHFFAIAGGGLAGLMVVIGLIVLLIRKFAYPRVRTHTTAGGYFTILWLLLADLYDVNLQYNGGGI